MSQNEPNINGLRKQPNISVYIHWGKLSLAFTTPLLSGSFEFTIRTQQIQKVLTCINVFLSYWDSHNNFLLIAGGDPWDHQGNFQGNALEESATGFENASVVGMRQRGFPHGVLQHYVNLSLPTGHYPCTVLVPPMPSVHCPRPILNLGHCTDFCLLSLDSFGVTLQ